MKPELAGKLGPQVHDPICLRLGLKNLGIYTDRIARAVTLRADIFALCTRRAVGALITGSRGGGEGYQELRPPVC